MVPAAIPIMPPMTLAELLGPLAPSLVVGVLAGLGVLVALLAGASWAVRAPRVLAGSAWLRAGWLRAVRHSIPAP